MNLRPIPRLTTAIQRLGVSASLAAAVINTHRNDPNFCDFGSDLIACAFLQRRARLAVHPNAPRDPSVYRRGFGRFPEAAR